jgi:hypothetical protein
VSIFAATKFIYLVNSQTALFAAQTNYVDEYGETDSVDMGEIEGMIAFGVRSFDEKVPKDSSLVEWLPQIIESQVREDG